MNVSKNIRISDLISKIIDIKEVNIDSSTMLEKEFTHLILYTQNLGTVRGVFNQDNKLTQYKLVTNEIHAQEVLTAKGKEYVTAMWNHNAEYI